MDLFFRIISSFVFALVATGCFVLLLFLCALAFNQLGWYGLIAIVAFVSAWGYVFNRMPRGSL